MSLLKTLLTMNKMPSTTSTIRSVLRIIGASCRSKADPFRPANRRTRTSVTDIRLYRYQSTAIENSRLRTPLQKLLIPLPYTPKIPPASPMVSVVRLIGPLRSTRNCCQTFQPRAPKRRPTRRSTAATTFPSTRPTQAATRMISHCCKRCVSQSWSSRTPSIASAASCIARPSELDGAACCWSGSVAGVRPGTCARRASGAPNQTDIARINTLGT